MYGNNSQETSIFVLLQHAHFGYTGYGFGSASVMHSDISAENIRLTEEVKSLKTPRTTYESSTTYSPQASIQQRTESTEPWEDFNCSWWNDLKFLED
jgi:hypothetical protein